MSEEKLLVAKFPEQNPENAGVSEKMILLNTYDQYILTTLIHRGVSLLIGGQHGTLQKRKYLVD